MKPRFNTAFFTANVRNRPESMDTKFPYQLSPGLFSALGFAQKEAESMGARFVDTSHILLALVHEAYSTQESGITIKLANFYKLRYSNTLDKAGSYFGLEAKATPHSSSSYLTEASKRLFLSSAQIAQRYFSNVIKPEHVLLAITMASNKSGAAYGTLIDLGIDPRELKDNIQSLIQAEILQEMMSL